MLPGCLITPLCGHEIQNLLSLNALEAGCPKIKRLLKTYKFVAQQVKTMQD